jgi:hypothetical protein
MQTQNVKKRKIIGLSNDSSKVIGLSVTDNQNIIGLSIDEVEIVDLSDSESDDSIKDNIL